MAQKTDLTSTDVVTRSNLRQKDPDPTLLRVRTTNEQLAPDCLLTCASRSQPGVTLSARTASRTRLPAPAVVKSTSTLFNIMLRRTLQS